MQKSLFLIGARGAGKTFVGASLAEHLDYRFYDTDELICLRQECRISEIVSHHGWPEFRRVEQIILEECCSLQKCVIATGGGAVLHEEVWQDIKQRGVVIWLKAPVETLINRIAGDEKSMDSRPSLTGAGTLEEYRKVLHERTPLYERTAHHIIDTGPLDRTQIVTDIVRVIDL